MEQHFSLSWREFQGNLSLGCARLLGSGEFADVTLAVEGQLLQAHRLVLSICSPYFQRMFHANPCQHPIVVLKDISYRAMKSLLQFMYNGEVSVRQEDLTSFISTAETLEIKGLTSKLSNQTDPDRSKDTATATAKSSNTTENIIDNDILSNDSDNLNITTNQQISMIHQLNKLTSLKRKCDSFLQNNCTVDPINKDQTVHSEKRTKLREKQILNRHKIANSYQKKNSVIENQNKNDVPYSPGDLNKESLNDSKENSNDPKFYSDEPNIRDSINSQGSTYTLDDDKTVDSEFVMVKKENGDEESDCTIEEFPVRNEVISVRNDLTSESQLTLSSPSRNDQQVSDGVLIAKPERSSARLAPWPISPQSTKGYLPYSEHKIVTIPQKEDGKKKYPQKSCRYCWRTGRRRDTRFMCEQCCMPLCKFICFEQHLLTSDLDSSINN